MIALNWMPPATFTGPLRGADEESPNWPIALSPQHHASPLAAMPQTCEAFVLMATSAGTVGTSCGRSTQELS